MTSSNVETVAKPIIIIILLLNIDNFNGIFTKYRGLIGDYNAHNLTREERGEVPVIFFAKIFFAKKF